jgi:hypothetical protein
LQSGTGFLGNDNLRATDVGSVESDQQAILEQALEVNPALEETLEEE